MLNLDSNKFFSNGKYEYAIMNILSGSIVFVQYYVYLPDHRIMAKNEVHQMGYIPKCCFTQRWGPKPVVERERKKPVINNLPL